ncbi:hypothetical protein [Streptomyces sp. NBC_01669]|uniref:hypothetical protein n=1 Tax=Streptomyces sp. NBC_01669 TaxID=2975909 RepID=UPI002252195A|nr:hypothetical protein [Streptomyces sp. NBC_01669]MCX4537299.1 hypothetical protein [Streptomyces sp. NBC_01669]
MRWTPRCSTRRSRRSAPVSTSAPEPRRARRLASIGVTDTVCAHARVGFQLRAIDAVGAALGRLPNTRTAPQTVSTTWNGAPSWDTSGNIRTMKPNGNGSLAAGASTTFGFSVMTNGSSATPSIRVCTAS